LNFDGFYLLNKIQEHFITQENMQQHEMQQIIIFYIIDFSTVLFPCENQGVTVQQFDIEDEQRLQRGE
jgi:hypothetical protein